MTDKSGKPENIDRQAVIDELNHRLKNVFTIMQALVTQSERQATDVAEFADDLRARIAAFAKSHEQLERSGFTAAPLRELIEIKLQPFAPGEDRLTLDGPDVELSEAAFTATSMALHELTTNAVKYGALSESRGRLTLTWYPDEDGNLEILWNESDGPRVSQPAHAGLGSRILENVISHSLQGTTEVDFEESGLKVRIVIPAAHVKEGAASAAIHDHPDETPIDLPADFSVLVVEDNAVIALDIADIMTQIGATRVETAASVDEARDLVSDMSPDFVLLDVNLGEETSLEFADELARDDVTFAFMTGADGTASLPGDLGRRPVLQKPYSDASIRTLLGRMAAGR